MSKVVTMTEFLRNPKKVRALVSQNVKVYVVFEGKICMIIISPNQTDLSQNPEQKMEIPTANIGLNLTQITRDDIYDENSWLNKPNQQ